MKSIRFSEEELEFLKNHYELELIEAENYITEIKNILKKLGFGIPEKQVEKKAGKRRGRPRKNEKKSEEVTQPAPEKSERKKPGPKTKKKGGRKTSSSVKKTRKTAIIPESTENLPGLES